MPPPKSSEVWNHFQKRGNDVNCLYCSTKLYFESKTGTTNLFRHLRRKHRDIYPDPKRHKTTNLPIVERINVQNTNIDLDRIFAMSVGIGAEIFYDNQCSTIDSDIAVRSTNTNSEMIDSVQSTNINCTDTNYTFESIPSASTEMLPTSAMVESSALSPEFQSIHQVSNLDLTTNSISVPLPLHHSKQIDYQLLKLIVKENHPFKIVEEPEFRNLINLLCPAYEIPTKQALISSILPTIHNDLKLQMKSLFKPDTAVCLTADGWTSQNNQNYFCAITAHFIDENTTLQNVLLDCIRYQEQHTVDNISHMLKDTVSQWGIQQNVTAFVAGDNINSMLETERNLGWKQVKCIAHVLNSAINTGFELHDFKQIIIKIKNIVDYFKENSHALSKLEEIKKKYNQPSLKLKQGCLPRWNSTYDMIDRFYALKNSVIITLAINNPKLNNLSAEEWKIISKWIEILQIFKSVTENLCSEKHVTLSKVPVYISFMFEKLNEHIVDQKISCIKEFCEIIKHEIQSALGDIENQDLFAQAALLDPRIKSHGLLPENAEKAIANIQQMLTEMNTNQNQQDVDKNGEQSNLNQCESQSLIWGEFDNKVKDLLTVQNSPVLNVEIANYLNEALLDRSQDPFIWWKQRRNIYPLLYKLMLKRLCITATSVPSENFFSKKGQIINERRRSLKPEISSSIIFISHNFK